MQNIRTKDDNDFDMCFTDAPFGTPSNNPSDSTRGVDDQLEDSDFLKYAEKQYKKLKNGSYAFIITSADYSTKWKDAMRIAGFNVWGGLFVLVRSMQAKQLRKKGILPASFCRFRGGSP